MAPGDYFYVDSYHINVGTGDGAIHVLAKSTAMGDRLLEHAVLIDAGDGSDDGLNRTKTLIKELGTHYNTPGNMLKFDAVVVTHWDADHFKGLSKLIVDDLKVNKENVSFFKYSAKDLKPETVVYAPYWNDGSTATGEGFGPLFRTGEMLTVDEKKEEAQVAAAKKRIAEAKAKKDKKEDGKQFSDSKAIKPKKTHVEGPENSPPLNINSIVAKDIARIQTDDIIGMDFFTGAKLDKQASKKKPPSTPIALLKLHKRETNSDGAPGMFCIISNHKCLGNQGKHVINKPISKTNQSSIGCIIIWPGPNPRLSHYFAGDLDYENELSVIQWVGGANVSTVKASHHGASSSSPTALFEKFQPSTIVLSNGSLHGHPSWELLLYIEAYAAQRGGGPDTAWMMRYPHWLSVDKGGKYESIGRFDSGPLTFVKESEDAVKKMPPEARKKYRAAALKYSEYVAGLQKFNFEFPGEFVKWKTSYSKVKGANPSNFDIYTKVADRVLEGFKNYTKIGGTAADPNKVTVNKTSKAQDRPGTAVHYIKVESKKGGNVLSTVLTNRTTHTQANMPVILPAQTGNTSNIQPPTMKSMKPIIASGLYNNARVLRSHVKMGFLPRPRSTQTDGSDDRRAQSSLLNSHIVNSAFKSDGTNEGMPPLLPGPVLGDPGPKCKWSLCSSCFDPHEPQSFSEYYQIVEGNDIIDQLLCTLLTSCITFESYPLAQVALGSVELRLEKRDDLLVWMKDAIGCSGMTATWDPINNSIASLNIELPHGLRFSTEFAAVAVGLKAEDNMKLGMIPKDGAMIFGLDPISPKAIFSTCEILNLAVGDGEPPFKLGSAFTGLFEDIHWGLEHGQPDAKKPPRNAVWFTPCFDNFTMLRLGFTLEQTHIAKLNQAMQTLLGAVSDRVAFRDIRLISKLSSHIYSEIDGKRQKALASELTLLCTFVISFDAQDDPKKLVFELDLDMTNNGDTVTIRLQTNEDEAPALSDVLIWVTEMLPASMDCQPILQKVAGGALKLRCLQLTLNNGSFVMAGVDIEVDFCYGKMDDMKNEIVPGLFSFSWDKAGGLVPTISGSLWTQPEIAGPPPSYFHEYEEWDTLQPSVKGVESISILTMLPCNIKSLPPGFPTQIYSARFTLSKDHILVGGAMFCDVMTDKHSAPFLRLDEISVEARYGFETKALEAALAFKLALRPPKEGPPGPDSDDEVEDDIEPLADSDCVINGSITYDSLNNSWSLRGEVTNLKLGDLRDYFDPRLQGHVYELLKEICISSMVVQYEFDNANGTSFIFLGTIQIGLVELQLVYSYQSTEWYFEACLNESQDIPESITVRQLIISFCGAESDVVNDLPDFILDTVVLAQSSSTDAAVFFLSVRKSSNKSVSFDLHVAVESLEVSFTQIYDEKKAEANAISKTPLPPKRIIRATIKSLPMPEGIPLLSTIDQPFDELYVTWLNEDLENEDVDMLLPEIGSRGSESPKLTAGLHVGILSSGKVILDHPFSHEKKKTFERADDEEKDNAPVKTPVTASSDKPASSSTKYDLVLGPLSISQIALQFASECLTISLTATFRLGPVEVDIYGFALKLNFKSLSLSALPKVEVAISGLGMQINKPPLVLAGMLQEITSNLDKIWLGGIAAEYGSYMFEAAGAYGMTSQDPNFKTFFIYLQVLGPLMNIDGIELSELRGGMGYNSELRFPDPVLVPTFPFTALSRPEGPQNPLDTFNSLMSVPAAWIKPTLDSYWFALGLKASAFGVLDAAVAVAVQLKDSKVTLGIFADCCATVPSGSSPEDAFAYVELGVACVIDFDAGSMIIGGQLTPTSFILSKNCHVTGGFAGATWFGDSMHAGDWVFTIGGYHPRYEPPSHYPSNPRLGISWQVNDCLSILGQSYFAITPRACMGGGILHAQFNWEGFSAQFTAYIDFLMNYKPLFFNLTAGIEIHAAFELSWHFIHHTFQLDLTANLYLEGEPIHGQVDIGFPIRTLRIAFGEVPNKPPPKLSISEFYASLQQRGTPAKDPLFICTRGEIAAASSSPKSKNPIFRDGEDKDDASEIWTVRSGTFSFEVRCLFGVSQIKLNNGEPSPTNPSKVYAKPMQIPADKNITSKLDINITPPDPNVLPMKMAILNRQVPEAVWASYDPVNDPSNTTGTFNESYLLDTTTSATIPQIYGVRFSSPDPHMSADDIPPFDPRLFTVDILPGKSPVSPEMGTADTAWRPQVTTASEVVKTWSSSEPSRTVDVWAKAAGWSGRDASKLASGPPVQLLEGFAQWYRSVPCISHM